MTERERERRKEGRKERERWGRKERKGGEKGGGKKALSITDRNARLFQTEGVFYFRLLKGFNIVKVYHALSIEK